MSWSGHRDREPPKTGARSMNADVRPLRHLRDVRQLVSHDLRRADQAMQHRLIQHDDHMRGCGRSRMTCVPSRTETCS